MHLPIWQVSVWVQASPSLQAVPSCTIVPWHEPFRQASLAVHSFPSSQLVPSGDGAPMQTPAWQVSVCVQVLPSSQDAPSGSGLLPMQAPAWQVSVCVQLLPSSHGAPSGRGVLPIHAPAWRVSVCCQVLTSSQDAPSGSGLLPMQAPAWQASVWVQLLPSSHGAPSGRGLPPTHAPASQAVPSGFAGFEHWPLAGSQVPTWWHWSWAAQTTGFVPVQLPPWQVSAWVQASPSLQAVPSGMAGFEHWPLAGSQVPAAWPRSWAVQTTGLVPVQLPPWQVSAWVQASPSLQAVPSGMAGFEQTPVTGSQVPASWH